MESMAARWNGIQILGHDGETSFSFGKEFAGHAVAIEEVEPRVWVVRVGEPVAENERWLLDPEVQATLDRALERAQTEPYRETDLDELEERILGGPRPDSTGSE
jgi:hypothetical protein